MTVVVVGADPEPLAADLRADCGLPVRACLDRELPRGIEVAVLAVDLSCAVGGLEERRLAELRAAGVPIALVGVGAGQDRTWPARLAQARDTLDPAHRLPVFAVALGLSGASDVALWCRAPGPAVAGVAEPATPRRSAPEPEPGPLAAATRAERMAGARIGFAALRAQLAGNVRAGAHELSRAVGESGARLSGRDAADLQAWLHAALLRYRDRIDDELAAGIEHIRAAALLGLPDVEPAPVPRGRPATTMAPPVAQAPRRRFAADDAVVLALGASAGLGLGRVSVVPLVQWAGLGAAGTVLTVLAGLAVAAGVVAVRRSAAARTARNQAAAEAVAAARSTLEHAVAAGLGAAEAHLSRELWNRTASPCVQPSRR
ncbi:hypothetical protein ACFQNE_00185 [Gordonia phosphorivorans]|uniref:Uncharacterized protein n=1 Tax=Gordonia phosphorivorans TaxID=1056982 RepID=A0ABV6HC26_9ACTN